MIADDRAFAIHCARVMLAEASRRRHSFVNRNYYWTLIAFAQEQRRHAASLRVVEQGALFA